MNTVVHPDPETDRRNLEAAYADPGQFDDTKIFPGTDWEFSRPKAKDIIGFLAAVGVCAVVIGLLIWLVGIGA